MNNVITLVESATLLSLSIPQPTHCHPQQPLPFLLAISHHFLCISSFSYWLGSVHQCVSKQATITMYLQKIIILAHLKFLCNVMSLQEMLQHLKNVPIWTPPLGFWQKSYLTIWYVLWYKSDDYNTFLYGTQLLNFLKFFCDFG